MAFTNQTAPAVQGTDEDMAKIALHLLLQPGLSVGAGPFQALAPKDAALLAVLALDGPTTRSRLASWLWPGTPTEQARANLRQRLLRMRRLVGVDVAVGDLALVLSSRIRHDLHDAEARLRRDPHALSGEVLGGIEFRGCEELESWLSQARSQWRARCQLALSSIADELEHAGQAERALVYVQRLMLEEPLHEQHHCRLMRLHLQRGDRSAALAVHANLCDVLQRDLGIIPGREADALRYQAAEGARTGSRQRVLVFGTIPGRCPTWPTHSGVLTVQARPSDQPYALLQDVHQALSAWLHPPARGRVPALGDLPAHGLQIAQTLETLFDRARPQALVIEDMQHADRASLEVLGHILRQAHWWQ